MSSRPSLDIEGLGAAVVKAEAMLAEARGLVDREAAKANALAARASSPR